MKIFYIGSTGQLSIQPFLYLLNTGYEVCGVGVDIQIQSTNQIPLLASHETGSLRSEASVRNIAVVNLNQSIADVVGAVSKLQPDLILVSCYARKLVSELLLIPRLGCFNIHPSLLPAYRGPIPLFWHFRDGAERFGVSLHYMVLKYDAGAVICQRAIAISDGLTMNQTNACIAGEIPALLEKGLPAIANGSTGLEQNEADASYFGYPDSADFAVSTGWRVRRLFNFMRATAHMGHPYACEVRGRTLQLKFALSYVIQEKPEFSIDLQQVSVPCADGLLVASYYH